MAKTPANVDEDVIRGMVTGDIPRLGVTSKAKPAPEEIEGYLQSESGTDSEVVESTVSVDIPCGEATKPRRRKEPRDYASAFLRKREPAQKRQTYISAAHFAKITEILAVVASDLTVPTFLDNLITDHLEKYRDEINALYSEKFKKPL